MWHQERPECAKPEETTAGPLCRLSYHEAEKSQFGTGGSSFYLWLRMIVFMFCSWSWCFLMFPGDFCIFHNLWPRQAFLGDDYEWWQLWWQSNFCCFYRWCFLERSGMKHEVEVSRGCCSSSWQSSSQPLHHIIIMMIIHISILIIITNYNCHQCSERSAIRNTKIVHCRTNCVVERSTWTRREPSWSKESVRLRAFTGEGPGKVLQGPQRVGGGRLKALEGPLRVLFLGGWEKNSGGCLPKRDGSQVAAVVLVERGVVGQVSRRLAVWGVSLYIHRCCSCIWSSWPQQMLLGMGENENEAKCGWMIFWGSICFKLHLRLWYANVFGEKKTMHFWVYPSFLLCQRGVG